MTEILRVKTWADAHPLSKNDMSGILPVSVYAHCGDLPEFTCQITFNQILVNYKVVYTLEVFEDGLARHLSISSKDQFDQFGSLPNPIFVSEIIKRFGFIARLADCQIWRNKEAINILEWIQ